MVSSLPCATYTKNDVTETKIGAVVHNSEKQTALTRAVSEQSATLPAIHESSTGAMHTLDHPLHLSLTGIEDPLNPTVFPSKELDELDRADELVQDAHTFVARGGHALLDPNSAPRHEVVQRPCKQEHEEPGERGPA